MKYVIAILFVAFTFVAVAQGQWPSVAINTLEIFPSPTHVTAPTKVVAKISAVHPCLAGVPSITVSNFQIDVQMCYREYYPDSYIHSRSDTIVIGQLAPGNYSLRVVLFVDMTETNCNTGNPVESTRTFTVLSGSSVAETELSPFSTSPSPFSQFIKIAGAGAKAQYRLLALDGKLADWQLVENGEIDTATLAEGLYLLEVQSVQGLYRQKVLKMP